MPYYRRNYGSQFPDGCICGPSGNASEHRLFGLGALAPGLVSGLGFMGVYSLQWSN